MHETTSLVATQRTATASHLQVDVASADLSPVEHSIVDDGLMESGHVNTKDKVKQNHAFQVEECTATWQVHHMSAVNQTQGAVPHTPTPDSCHNQQHHTCRSM
jgi:hypothetical protein